jgi:alpha-L-arabinofuranosidase
LITTRRSFLGAWPALYGLLKKHKLAAAARAAREIHVSVSGNDRDDGSLSRPLRTISAAAERAYPGDTITVHAGVYRERVAPPRGGMSDANRIVYRAAPGEGVTITGAEVVSGWARVDGGVGGDVWNVTIPNSFFGGFNPYSDVIHGDWFSPLGRVHHTGAVYLDGEWLAEAAALDDVMKKSDGEPLWFARVDADATTIWAQFRGADPNQRVAEINVRRTVFYSEKTGIDYITVRGFKLCKAATQWAPPTAEQIGVIGPHWSKGWIIEENTVSHSICCGISLGKYGDEWDNTSANSAQGYVKTIERALENGWSKEKIGHHIVRNNIVCYCEQAGIVGSLGPVFSTVTGNTIHDIYVRRLFSGAEIAGIKFHAAVDVEISNNHIYRAYRGLWLDWMAQGTHLTANMFHDNVSDVFFEVDHGPFVVDNNLFLSKHSVQINSQGGALAHNLICGSVEVNKYDGRMTPFMKPHSTEVAGYHDNPSGDMRFFNNLFAQNGTLASYDETRMPNQFGGNVFLKGTTPCTLEVSALREADFDPAVELIEKSDGLYLSMALDGGWAKDRRRELVTGARLGLAAIPQLPFEQSDGTTVCLDRDFSGRLRSAANPFPGPFERPEDGKILVKVLTVAKESGNAN